MRMFRLVLPSFFGLLTMLLLGCGGNSTPGVSLIVSPTQVNLSPGEQLAMSVTYKSSAYADVNWQVTDITGNQIANAITASGTLTAPAVGTYQVIATSRTDASLTGMAVVYVQSSGAISAVTPATATVPLQGSQQFSATPANNITWSVMEGSSGGSVTASGDYLAPATAGIYHVVAISKTNATQTSVAVVTVPVQITINQPSLTLIIGAVSTFTATVTGSTKDTIIWSVQEGSAGGSITSGGVYTAPTVPGTYHIIAASTLFSGTSAIVPVTVQSGGSGTLSAISPASVIVPLLGTQQFTATPAGTFNWSVQEGSAGGLINASGLYTAPATAGIYHVLATSKTDATQVSVAVVTVPEQLQINPQQVALSINGAYTFTVTGSITADTIIWSIFEGPLGGSITSSGVYTAPSLPGTYHVIATSSLFSGVSDTIPVTVQSGSASGTIF
jgi:hypothetical protein